MANSPARRKVVAGLAAALALGEAPILAAEHGDLQLSALRSALLEVCGRTNVSADLARACISHCPDSVLSRTTGELVASFVSGVSFRDWLREQTTADFAAGRVVRVQGWVISETEFLLFARLGA